MGQYNKAVLTSAGENLIARAVAGEIQLSITKAKTSNFVYPVDTDFKALTDMQGIKQVMESPETTILSDNLIQTRTLFSNEEIEITYYIQNIGLYVLDGTQEVLFCIVTASTPDEMPRYNGVASTSYIYNIQNAIQDAAELHIMVNPSGTATIQDVLERVDATGGDISETVIETLETVDTEFPVPNSGESSKTFLGKIRKFIQDFNNFKAGIITLGKLVNNGQTTEPGFVLDARYGKTLYDLYAQLNTDLSGKLATATFNTHKTSADHDGRYYTETEINSKLAAITTTSLGAYSSIKTVYASSSSSYTLAAGEVKAFTLPSPSASDISGYGLIGTIRVYSMESAGIAQVGYWGGGPGNDVYFKNLNDFSSTFRIDAVYLYAKK